MIRKNYRTTIIYKIRKSCKLRLSKVLKMFDLILLNFSVAQLPLICAFLKLDPKICAVSPFRFTTSFSLLCNVVCYANTIRIEQQSWYHSPLEVLASSPHPILTQPWIIWAATSTNSDLLFLLTKKDLKPKRKARICIELPDLCTKL
jgi:hypothetical protein